jgi:hypothetical protein
VIEPITKAAHLFTDVYEEHKNIDAVSINVITFDEHDVDSGTLFDLLTSKIFYIITLGTV